MATAAELLNRRIGRMEALAHDLSQVKPGYQPTELELLRARELYAALGQFPGVVIPEIGEAVRGPELGAKSETADSRKPKTRK